MIGDKTRNGRFFTMAMIGYVARVLTGVRFKKMNHMIDVVHQKCGQNKVRTAFTT